MTGISGRTIALTGGVASGKSTVAEILSKLGHLVIDADQLAREVVAKGTPGLQRVVDAFGPEVLTDDGEMDRAKVGEIVFADEGKRRELEAIIHPLVRLRSAHLEETAQPGALVVHDIPLLVETGQEGRFDFVIVVDAPDEARIERMMTDRGWSREQAEARIAAQAPREKRLAAASFVIDNSGSIDDLPRQVNSALEAARWG